MQFQGQSHILSVPLQTATPGIDELQGLFENAYWKRFEVELPEIRAVLVNLHTTVLGRRPGIDLAALGGGSRAGGVDGTGAQVAESTPDTSVLPATASAPASGRTGIGEGDAGGAGPDLRTVRFAAERRETRILRRESLGPGSTLEGPAIIEQLDTTTVLPPEFRTDVDHAGNLLIHVPGAPRE